MNNLLLKVSVKFGLILMGFNLIFGLISSLTFDPENTSQWITTLNLIVSWGVLLVVLPMAHYEFNKKNGNFISFQDAILIGLIILGISFTIGTLSTALSYEFILKEKLQILNSKLSLQYGADVEPYSLINIIKSSFVMLLAEIVVLFLIITAEAHWKIYTKAGKEGWACLVPIYNTVVLLEIVKKPTWWFIMLLIPFVNIIFAIWITNLLSKQFNKDEGFTVGLILLPFIFYPLLGLSDAQYIGASSVNPDDYSE